MKNFVLFSMVFLLLVSGCAPALMQAESTISPSVEQLKPGQVVMHPATENNLYAFYTYFPKSAVSEKNIVVGVWPHGGAMFSDDYEFHKEQARNTLAWLSSYAEKYKTPLVVVAIPRVEESYVHTMPVETFTTSDEFLKRPDLKLIEAVWSQYIPSLQEAGFNVKNKVFMMGFSSPGTFTFRFTILHPELISAAWLGSSSFAPLPTDEIFGQPADYPFGIRNLEQLTGQPFNLDDYKKVSFLIVTGENDNNENNVTINWYSNTDFIRKNMGETEPERIKFFYDYLVSIGVPAEFHLYPNIAHEITGEMMNDAFDFLVAHSQS